MDILLFINIFNDLFDLADSTHLYCLTSFAAFSSSVALANKLRGLVTWKKCLALPENTDWSYLGLVRSNFGRVGEEGVLSIYNNQKDDSIVSVGSNQRALS